MLKWIAEQGEEKRSDGTFSFVMEGRRTPNLLQDRHWCPSFNNSRLKQIAPLAGSEIQFILFAL